MSCFGMNTDKKPTAKLLARRTKAGGLQWRKLPKESLWWNGFSADDGIHQWILGEGFLLLDEKKVTENKRDLRALLDLVWSLIDDPAQREIDNEAWRVANGKVTRDHINGPLRPYPTELRKGG